MYTKVSLSRRDEAHLAFALQGDAVNMCDATGAEQDTKSPAKKIFIIVIN